jgi:hypothetical protein
MVSKLENCFDPRRWVHGDPPYVHVHDIGLRVYIVTIYLFSKSEV